MTVNSYSKKKVSFCFRGFECSPDYIESIIGVDASKKGVKGKPVKEGVKTILKRSYVLFSLDLPDTTRLDEFVPLMLSHLGGVDHLYEARGKVLPEYCEIDITLRVKSSEEQEGGFFPPSVIRDVLFLDATLCFQFL